MTNHLVRIANTCCHGRIVSVLEGGYNFYGRVVSPFARSVAAHVRSLANGSLDTWSLKEVKEEEQHEQTLLDEMERKRREKQQAKEQALLNVLKSAETEGPSEPTPTEKTSTAMKVVDEPQPPTSKRRRTNVDYVALAAKIDQENKG